MLPVPENKNRYTHSAALALDPFGPGEAAHDKIALLGFVDDQSETVVVSIHADTPTYAMRPNVLSEFGIDVPLSKDILALPQGPNTPAVLSAGTIFWIVPDHGAPNLALLRRDDKAPVLPDYLTFGQGRCTELPEITMAKEAGEEMILAVDNRLVLSPCPANMSPEAWQKIKWQQAIDKRAALEAAGVDVDAALRNEPISMAYDVSERDRALFRRIKIDICGETVADFEAMVNWETDYCATPVDALNAFAFNRTAILRVPDLASVKGIDAEPFNRTFELSAEPRGKLVPSLATYLANRAPA